MTAIEVREARRFFAEEIRIRANIHSARVVEALAAVPREQFLPPGPWQFRTAVDLAGPPRVTEDAEPGRVYLDVAIAIDAARNLYNGQPGVIARWLDVLELLPGQRVVHIGCGTGYFTALIAHVVGETGTVAAVDVDPVLAARARHNLREYPWVAVSDGNGATVPLENADRVLVHAGASHVLDAWLDALRDGGRLLVPVTVEFPGMPPGIGKGIMLLVTRRGLEWQAEPLGPMPVMIYSLREVRDPQVAAAVSQAIRSGALMRVSRLRRDRHDALATCIVHGSTNCLSA